MNRSQSYRSGAVLVLTPLLAEVWASPLRMLFMAPGGDLASPALPTSCPKFSFPQSLTLFLKLQSEGMP